MKPNPLDEGTTYTTLMFPAEDTGACQVRLTTKPPSSIELAMQENNHRPARGQPSARALGPTLGTANEQGEGLPGPTGEAISF